MTTTSQINETTLTLPYNARQTIEVAATNCIGTSATAMLTYFEGEVSGMPIVKGSSIVYCMQEGCASLGLPYKWSTKF